MQCYDLLASNNLIGGSATSQTWNCMRASLNFSRAAMFASWVLIITFVSILVCVVSISLNVRCFVYNVHSCYFMCDSLGIYIYIKYDDVFVRGHFAPAQLGQRDLKAMEREREREAEAEAVLCVWTCTHMVYHGIPIYMYACGCPYTNIYICIYICVCVCIYVYMIINDITFTTMAKQPPPEPHKN